MNEDPALPYDEAEWERRLSVAREKRAKALLQRQKLQTEQEPASDRAAIRAQPAVAAPTKAGDGTQSLEHRVDRLNAAMHGLRGTPAPAKEAKEVKAPIRPMPGRQQPDRTARTTGVSRRMLALVATLCLLVGLLGGTLIGVLTAMRSPADLSDPRYLAGAVDQAAPSPPPAPNLPPATGQSPSTALAAKPAPGRESTKLIETGSARDSGLETADVTTPTTSPSASSPVEESTPPKDTPATATPDAAQEIEPAASVPITVDAVPDTPATATPDAAQGIAPAASTPVTAVAAPQDREEPASNTPETPRQDPAITAAVDDPATDGGRLDAAEDPAAEATDIAEPSEEAAPPLPEHLRAARVVVHVPRRGSSDEQSRVTTGLTAAGLPDVTTVPVGLTIRETHLRYYHQADAAAAALLAEAIGAPARDFTGYTPRPDAGLVEVWVAGTAAAAPSASRRSTGSGTATGPQDITSGVMGIAESVAEFVKNLPPNQSR